MLLATLRTMAVARRSWLAPSLPFPHLSPSQDIWHGLEVHLGLDDGDCEAEMRGRQAFCYSSTALEDFVGVLDFVIGQDIPCKQVHHPLFSMHEAGSGLCGPFVQGQDGVDLARWEDLQWQVAFGHGHWQESCKKASQVTTQYMMQ